MAVGPTGHVWAAVPDPASKFAEPAASAIAADPVYPNVTVIQIASPKDMSSLPPLDMIWTAQNYHDLHLSQLHLDVPGLDKQWLNALKPGGVLMVIDHVATAGSPLTETADKLHRIDPAAAKAEIESAGFHFDGQTDVLAEPGRSAHRRRLRPLDPRQDRPVRLPVFQALTDQPLRPLEPLASARN